MSRVSRGVGPRFVAAVSLLLLVAPEAGLPQTYRPGTHVCAVHDFDVPASDGNSPSQIGAFALGTDGAYYSTTPSGGKSAVKAGHGTIFSISPDPNGLDIHYNSAYSFDQQLHGTTPLGGLTDGGDGYLYGTTYGGGLYRTNPTGSTMKYGSGTLFRFKPGAAEPEMLHTFRYGDTTGYTPEACATKPCHFSPQQQLNAAAGLPLSAPVLASDGYLYGVTSSGLGYGALGVLYKVAPYNGESGITALCISGQMPAVEATDLTQQELRDKCMFYGQYGSMPFGLTAGNGVLYGTTIQLTSTSYGTVFKVDIPSGKVTTLYNFTDPKNGSTPYGVIAASDGYLYGVTKYGGPLYGPGNPGAGVLYRISPTGGNFEIIHAFNGTTEGSQPVAGLVEAKSTDGGTYLYGSTAAGGETRGVLFRVLLGGTVGPPIPGNPYPYELRHVFSGTWSATGSFPTSTMLAVNDPKYGMTFYGTTLSGGTLNYGALFRMRGVDLPTVQNLSVTPAYSLQAHTTHTGTSVTLAGQSRPTTIDVYADVVATGSTAHPELSNDGLMIKTGNCRNPHVVQFEYREKIGADGTHSAGTYTESNGQSFQLTTDPNNPNWHTDTSGAPNPYYDQQFGVPVVVGPLSLTFFDQPNFGGTDFMAGAHETWRVTMKDYVICNCQVAGEVHWARQVLWIPDVPSSPAVLNNQGHQGPAQYVGLSIVPVSDPGMTWANTQIKADGDYPIP